MSRLKEAATRDTTTKRHSRQPHRTAPSSKPMPKGTPKNTKAKATKEPPAPTAPTGQREEAGRAGVATKEAVSQSSPPPAPAREPRGPIDGQPSWVPKYLDGLEETAQKAHSADLANITLRNVQIHRSNNPAFAAMESAAMKVSTDLIESEITRRAITGVVTSITTYPDGRIVQKIEYSDTLLLRLAERTETGTYVQKQRIEHSAPGMFATRAERKAALEKMRAEMAEQKAIDHDRPLPAHVEKTIGGRVVTEGK